MSFGQVRKQNVLSFLGGMWKINFKKRIRDDKGGKRDVLSIVSGMRVAMNCKGAYGMRMAGSGMSSLL